MDYETLKLKYEKRLNKAGFYYPEIDNSYIKYRRYGGRKSSPDVLTIFFDDEGITKIELIGYDEHHMLVPKIYDEFKSMEDLFEFLGA